MRTFRFRLPPSGPVEDVEIPEDSDDVANVSGVAGATVSAALDWLKDSDVLFGGVLPDANADIDSTDGSLFSVVTITDDRDYTLLAAGAAEFDTVAVECRNASGFTPSLLNGGAAPGTLVAMQNGRGYAAVFDGTDWVWTLTYRINP